MIPSERWAHLLEWNPDALCWAPIPSEVHARHDRLTHLVDVDELAAFARSEVVSIDQAAPSTRTSPSKFDLSNWLALEIPKDVGDVLDVLDREERGGIHRMLRPVDEHPKGQAADSGERCDPAEDRGGVDVAEEYLPVAGVAA